MRQHRTARTPRESSERVPMAPAPRDTFRPSPPPAHHDVGYAEQGSSAKFIRLELTGCHAGNSVRAGVLCQKTLRSVRRSSSRSRLPRRSLPNWSPSWAWATGASKRVTDRIDIMTFACSYASPRLRLGGPELCSTPFQPRRPSPKKRGEIEMFGPCPPRASTKR